MTHALVAEPYSLVQVRIGALEAVLYSENCSMRSLAAWPSGTVTPRRGRETLAHDYTRPPGPLGDEVGGLSTALRLFASLLLIVSTESVVVVDEGEEYINCSIY